MKETYTQQPLPIAARPLTPHAVAVQQLQLEHRQASPPPPNPQPQIEAAQGVRANPSPPPGGTPDPGDTVLGITPARVGAYEEGGADDDVERFGY